MLPNQILIMGYFSVGPPLCYTMCNLYLTLFNCLTYYKKLNNSLMEIGLGLNAAVNVISIGEYK